ncbi:unnamed protein product [Thelazia callipaeda]|uniref:Carm_PH domain-containing protein n=1 Tax=Thelazia callipaeda TaxID=103827 RepID=A0A158RCL5_THECL|nr:unnamed protein product [Thelazia callipaeda]
MSLSRGVQASELCLYVQEKCSSIFGSKFWDCRLACAVEYGTKSDKLEYRIFVLTKFRVFILHGKTPSSLKIDRTFHILSIRVIQVVNDHEVCFILDESYLAKRRIFIRLENGAKNIAVSVLSAFKHYFPDITQNFRNFIELLPAELFDEFQFLPNSRPYLPCHNFRRSYAALCDYYDLPFRDEVVWDVEKIYATHGVHILRLDDFTHLLSRDLLPIVAVCQYSCYFTGLCVDDIKLGAELVDIILSVIRNSRCLKVLILRNCSLPKDFIASFTYAVQSNIMSLEEVDFSKNLLEDKKGFVSLSPVLSKMTSLQSLTFSDCAMSEKSINLICYGILQGIKGKASIDCKFLTTLDFSGNNLKDDISDLLQLLSLCTNLRVLNLSGTSLNIDRLWASLIYGGLQLEILKLASCQTGRRSKENAQQMKEYFSTAALLLGLASNQQLKPLILCLNGVCDRNSITVLETCLSGVNVSSLSLKDNNLDVELLPVVIAASQMRYLTKLDLSGTNFPNWKRGSKNLSAVSNTLLEIIKLVGEDDSRLHDLSIADCRLGSHLSILLNTLGVASSLQSLDISNDMGNFGARLLAKALQINCSLKKKSDHRNSTLLSLPFPVIDVAESLNRADRTKTLAALTEIELCIEKNRAGRSHSEKQYMCSILASKQEVGTCDDGNIKNGSEELMRSLNTLDLSEELDIEMEKAAYDVMSRLDDIMISGTVQKIVNNYRAQCNSTEKDGPENVQNSGNGSPNINLLNSSKSIPSRSHRPKSVITELTSDEIEDKVNLDAPPMPSALSHPSKCRPRPMRNFKNIKPQLSLEEFQQIRCDGESVDDCAVYDIAANESSNCSPRESEIEHSNDLSIVDGNRPRSPAASRICTTLLSQEHFTELNASIMEPSAPPLLTSASVSSAVAPPIVPRRNKACIALVPPTLPPKPEQIVAARPVSCSDDENRSGRKSVADMARLFSSTDTPFGRRS